VNPGRARNPLDVELSYAVTAYLRNRRVSGNDLEAVAREAMFRTPQKLLAEVEDLVREMDSIPTDEAGGVFLDEWTLVGETMKARHPELSGAALQALSQQWFIGNR
jgi:hypothetical protein